MSEEETKTDATPTDDGAEKQPSPIVSIQINWNMATGDCQFVGPIGNKTICYGMLKMAEELVKSHVSDAQKKTQQSMIQKIIGLNNGRKLLKPS